MVVFKKQLKVLEPRKMTDKKKKGENKIKVDKDFFTELLKANTELREGLKNLKTEFEKFKKIEPKEPQPKIVIRNPQADSVFSSYETITENPKTPQEVMLFNSKVGEFRQKLLTLMKEYKVVQLTASILKKI